MEEMTRNYLRDLGLATGKVGEGSGEGDTAKHQQTDSKQTTATR